jgi:hypothetical protein
MPSKGGQVATSEQRPESPETSFTPLQAAFLTRFFATDVGTIKTSAGDSLL